MAEVYGENGFFYEYVDGWGTLPDGMTYVECPGVAVDSVDNVYILTRGEHPVIVFNKEGNFLRTFGEDLHYLFIVSSVEFGPAGDGAFRSGGDSGLVVGVERAGGAKCQRCWHYTTDVGADPEWPEICGRCVGHVREVFGGQDLV